MNSSESIILVVDDEPNTLKVVSAVLQKQGYAVKTALTFESAWAVLEKDPVQVVVTDLKLPDRSGLELLEEVKNRWPDMTVIMITAYGTIDNAVRAMKLGAYNYLTKPVNPDELLVVIDKALEKNLLLEENLDLKKQLKERYRLGNIVGRSKVMQEIFVLVEKVAGYDSNILITGETGTGKELIARAIHYSGKLQERPFVTIDCAAIPESLLESELFGHTKGAFTGAVEEKKGQIEMAEGGTLFLDEIGELPLALQKKFLRFLQEKEFVRVGGTRRRKVNIRLIAATNRDLEQGIQEGSWREDLFYRLNVISLEVPPLRKRKEDIPLLINTFLEKFNCQNNKSIRGVTKQVMDIFQEYEWPGNVRELENVIERAVVLSSGETITASCLPSKLTALKEENAPSHGLNLLEMEKNILWRALEQTNWNQSAAARVLGISRKQLRTKMGHHGML